MKVIFLDVDGVLNNCHTMDCIQEENYVYRLSRLCVERFQKSIEGIDCKIVLSSTWRKDEHAITLLEQFIPIYDVTDRDGKIRGDEIKRWLDNHPEVTYYVIVDDDSDFHDDQKLNFIQTDPEYGLTETLAYRLRYKLQHNGKRT